MRVREYTHLTSMYTLVNDDGIWFFIKINLLGKRKGEKKEKKTAGFFYSRPRVDSFIIPPVDQRSPAVRRYYLFVHLDDCDRERRSNFSYLCRKLVSRLSGVVRKIAINREISKRKVPQLHAPYL